MVRQAVNTFWNCHISWMLENVDVCMNKSQKGLCLGPVQCFVTLVGPHTSNP